MDKEQVEKEAILYNKAITRSIGKKFKTERESQNISQRKLSRLSSISLGTISELEQGMSLPKMEIVLKLGFTLGLSIKDIFSEVIDTKTAKDTTEGPEDLIRINLLGMGLKEKVANEIINFAKFKLSDENNYSLTAYQKLLLRGSKKG